MLLSKQNLRRPVPKCFNLVGKSFNWKAESPRKPEISDFKSASAINQQILRFKVSVDDSSGVAIVYAIAKLIKKQFDLVRSHSQLMLAEVFLHVVFN